MDGHQIAKPPRQTSDLDYGGIGTIVASWSPGFSRLFDTTLAHFFRLKAVLQPLVRQGSSNTSAGMPGRSRSSPSSSITLMRNTCLERSSGV